MRDDVARALATKALEVAQKAKSQQGPKGEKGDAGQIIVQPNKGDQGEQGPMGPQGIPGKSIVGPKGDKGDKGDPGLKGDKGDQGEAGKDGAQGERGERGFTGLKGANGSQGLIGPMPKHEKKGLMIRFEKEPGTWGEWIIMPTGGGGGGRDDKLTDRQAELVALAEFYKTRGGNANKFVKTDGTNLVWADGDGVGDVTGPASSTDNAVALFDGTTGKVLKNGVVLGDMAQQNANAVAITGGTINGTTIGATTPSTVNATTITGQTGVLRGTGQNLLVQSNTFTAANWTKSNLTAATTVLTTDPDGGNNAFIFTADGTSTPHYIVQATFTAGPASRTFSIYLKAGTNNFAQLMFGTDTAPFANFNLSTGVIGTVGTNATASMISVGNGWYRCIVTTTSTTATHPYVVIVSSNTSVRFETNSLATTIYAFGGQYELSSTANTYIPTTTTAVYGTPTLSFSGVSSIGLLSNGALYLQPAGTGALQAQATTSTTAGGNARGANAVDWQNARASAGQVASGAYSVISGGDTNTASGFNASINGGTGGTAGATYSFIGGGYFNTANGRNSSVVTGYTNTAGGFFSFIGGGFTNSGTSGSAVTTQATTTVTSGSTSVTLSGSNASIRVGQLITGTGIQTFPHTYVSAISGTTLTLSQNATATGTPTLSFFTPHGVVVGGGNNQATGSYSVICGGGDAGTAANRNVASGDWSVVAGGGKNTASGQGSFVGGGGTTGSVFGGNTASGQTSAVVGGFANTASGVYAFVGGGNGNVANAQGSHISGGYTGTTRSIVGNAVFPAHIGPLTPVGASQAALLVLARQTTDATPTALASSSAAAGSTNQVILPNNSAYFFRGEVISGKTAAGDTKGWTIEGVIKRGANAASTALVGIPTVTSTYADLGAATWDIAVTADTTNGGIRVTFTGQAATTIRTVCSIRSTEMTF
jgi:hypothetical protein